MPEKPEKKAAIEKALRGFKFINPIRDKVGKGKKKKPTGLKGRKGKPYSVFYVHSKLKYLKLLILFYSRTDCLESVKISWQSM